MIQRGSVAGCRVGGRDDGGAMRGDGAVGVGALVDRREVSDLERLDNRPSVVCAHATRTRATAAASALSEEIWRSSKEAR